MDDENECECEYCLNECDYCLNKKKKNSISKKEKTTTDILKQVGWFIGETALISGIGVVGMSLLPSVLGFTTGGVAARSMAAIYQSRFLGGTIAKGSLFSIMQRIGVKGFATSTKVMVGAGASMIYSAASTSSNIMGKKKCTCKRSQMKTK